MTTNKPRLYANILEHLVKALIALVFAIAVTALFGKQIAAMGALLKEKRAASFALEQRNAAAADLRTQFAAIIGTNDARILSAFPPSDDVLEFVAALESLAHRANIDQMIKFDAPQPPTEYAGISVVPIPFTLTLNGTRTTLAGYLEQFETLPYFAGIKELTIVSSQPTGWNDNSSITIHATLYTRQNI